MGDDLLVENGFSELTNAISLLHQSLEFFSNCLSTMIMLVTMSAGCFAVG
jgi:hypothetical protein